MSDVYIEIDNNVYWVAEDSNKYLPYQKVLEIKPIYRPYYKDFGPINIEQILQYCNIIREMKGEDTLIILSDKNVKHLTNSILVVCCYRMLNLGLNPYEARSPFRNIKTVGYCDAGYRSNKYRVHVLDCLKSLYRARQLDLLGCYFPSGCGPFVGNWLIPKKFFAIKGPVDDENDLIKNKLRTTEFIQILKQNNVALVIRLNQPEYDARQVIDAGIRHTNLIFPDGACPCIKIVYDFLKTSSSIDGVIGVHCKAGLGRTGTLIGCFAILFLGFSAREWICWSRFCRQGSVLGEQQQFLELIETHSTKIKELLKSDFCSETHPLDKIFTSIDTHQSSYLLRTMLV